MAGRITDDIVRRLGLDPHPEGGYFREIFRSPIRVQTGDGRGERSALTSILFLVTAGNPSRWHRVHSDEVWHHLEGDRLELRTWDAATGALEVQPLDREHPVALVPARRWQTARTLGEHTLVGCTVAPGFEFEDFEMMAGDPATAARLGGQHPDAARWVEGE